MSDRNWAALGGGSLIVGGALAVVGSSSHWLHVINTTGPGTVLVARSEPPPGYRPPLPWGPTGIGHVTLYLGIACLALGLSRLSVARRGWLIAVPAFAAGIAVVACSARRAVSISGYSDRYYIRIPLSDGTSRRTLFHTGIAEHIGGGLWVTLIGGGIIIVAALMGIASRDNRAGAGSVAVAVTD